MYPRRIKELREDRDISQDIIARLLDTSQQQISRYEKGTEMPYNCLIKIADFYNVSIDYLLERTNKKEVNR